MPKLLPAPRLAFRERTRTWGTGTSQQCVPLWLGSGCNERSISSAARSARQGPSASDSVSVYGSLEVEDVVIGRERGCDEHGERSGDLAVVVSAQTKRSGFGGLSGCEAGAGSCKREVADVESVHAGLEERGLEREDRSPRWIGEGSRPVSVDVAAKVAAPAQRDCAHE